MAPPRTTSYPIPSHSILIPFHSVHPKYPLDIRNMLFAWQFLRVWFRDIMTYRLLFISRRQLKYLVNLSKSTVLLCRRMGVVGYKGLIIHVVQWKKLSLSSYHLSHLIRRVCGAFVSPDQIHRPRNFHVWQYRQLLSSYITKNFRQFDKYVLMNNELAPSGKRQTVNEKCNWQPNRRPAY